MMAKLNPKVAAELLARHRREFASLARQHVESTSHPEQWRDGEAWASDRRTLQRKLREAETTIAALEATR